MYSAAHWGDGDLMTPPLVRTVTGSTCGLWYFGFLSPVLNTSLQLIYSQSKRTSGYTTFMVRK